MKLEEYLSQFDNEITNHLVEDQRKLRASDNSPISDSAIEAYRKELGTSLDTIAIGVCDIEGFEELNDKVFKGASIKVRKAAGLKDMDEDEVLKHREIRAPYDHLTNRSYIQFCKHAEENVIAEFEHALNELLKEKNMDKSQVKGHFYLKQSTQTGVCNHCALDLRDENKKKAY